MAHVQSDWKQFLGMADDGEEAAPVVRQVVKRNGKLERYDRSKIQDAIAKAVVAVRGGDDPELVERLTRRTEEHLGSFMHARHPNSAPAIEEIQDIVETVLIEAKEVDIAKAYILYRSRHEAIRDTRKLMIDIGATMDGYLYRSDWRVNENANVNFSLGGLILTIREP